MKYLHTNERGVAHLALLVAAVLVLAVGATGYFVFSKQNKSDDASSVSNKVAEAECKKEIDDKDFCKFVSNWSYGKEQRMVMSMSDGSTSTYETDANGNTRMVTSQGGAETSAFISIGKTSYIKNVDDGKWTKYTTQETETDTTTPESNNEIEEEFDFEKEVAKDTASYTAQGKEACGNLSCFKYEITDTAQPGEKTVLWFDDKDYKLRRMVVSGADGSSDFTMSYDVAAITEPSPVVEAPDYENMSEAEMQQLLDQYTE